MMECDNVLLRNVSYLRARDPSIIISYNISNLKTNLCEEFKEEDTQQLKETKTEDKIRVFLRLKDGYSFEDLYEIYGNTLISKVPPGSNFLRNVKEGETIKKTFTFTKIFEPNTTQADIFNYIVKPKILDFINGQNSSLLTYGASGSGKTFTVIGTDEQPGIIPRSLEYLFRTLPQLSQNPRAKPLPTGNVTLLNEADRKKEKLLCRSLLNASSSSMDRTQHVKTYMAMQQRLSGEPVAELEHQSDVTIAVWVSFAEIYNEHIYDLLQRDPPRGHQRPKLRLGMSNGHTYIKDLTSVNVTSGQEAYEILQYGIHNLNYASTQLNKHSSRSHSIFTITLVQYSTVESKSYVSSFKFCDLAGSERSKKTHNVGDRLKESNNINSSLLVLSRCIAAVRNLQKHNDQKLVPFRESKLTQLFQNALAGSEDIAMIINISPSREMFDESQHVLNFAAVAKEISIERKPEPVFKKKNRFSQLVEESSNGNCDTIEQLRDTVQTLYDELEQQRIDFEVTQKMNLKYLAEQYENLLSSVEADTQRRIQNAEKKLTLAFEAKLENMKRRYERKIEEYEQKNLVIEIASSDEDEEKESNENAHEQTLKELRITLSEGVDQCKELEAKNKLLEQENKTLREKVLELENELDTYKHASRYESESYSSDEDLGEQKVFNY